MHLRYMLMQLPFLDVRKSAYSTLHGLLIPPPPPLCYDRWLLESDNRSRNGCGSTTSHENRMQPNA